MRTYTLNAEMKQKQNSFAPKTRDDHQIDNVLTANQFTYTRRCQIQVGERIYIRGQIYIHT